MKDPTKDAERATRRANNGAELIFSKKAATKSSNNK